ncbi:MAG: hypothetical protein JNM25_03370 [Planctomycetes bacterium]|nr:hypothetical protein [Planctomycetota bacterium]
MSRGSAVTGMALAALLLAPAPAAQARDERTASVGMRARIDEVVLEGSELTVAPTDHKAPVVVRVLAVRPHGQHCRYDLEWQGLAPGTFDLVRYLARKDGSPVAGLPPLQVTVTSVLPKGVMDPSEPGPEAPPRLRGYTALQIVVGALWGIGLLLILFVGRRWRRVRVAATPAPTLADRMRPLVESVAAGRADDAAKAELERLLVAFWRARLDLRASKAAAAIVAIRAHPEAGALLRQVEAWLHRPVPPASFDVAALLAPYRSVSAADFAAEAHVR